MYDEKPTKINQAYGSRPDDYADIELVNSQRVNDMRTINQTPTPIPSESEPPDMYDPDSRRWAEKIEAYYNMMQKFGNIDNRVEDEYIDEISGQTVNLMNGSVKSMAENVHKAYKSSIGKKIDPYGNFIGLFTKKLLQTGDNVMVEFAKTFVGKLPYVFGGTSLTTGADCSNFIRGIFLMFGKDIPQGTANIAADAKKDKHQYTKLIIGPGMDIKSEKHINFSGTKEEAFTDINVFCNTLDPGDLILFDLGSRNPNSFGSPNHVVMYAGKDPETGEHMIVEEYDDDYGVLYRPINSIIFIDPESGEERDDWKTRLPVFSVSYLTDAERYALTVFSGFTDEERRRQRIYDTPFAGELY